MKRRVKKWLLGLYEKLPLGWDVQAIKMALAARGPHDKLMECTAVLQAIEALRAGNERYRDPQRLLVHGAQYWSQNYEDGMIAEIFKRIGTTTKTFLEIGIGDGTENNTTFLLVSGWSGWWIDGSKEGCDIISRRMSKMPGMAKRLNIKQAFAAPENLEDLFLSMGVPREIDFFSLDIDLNTYHIWAALPHFKPRVIAVEYNAGLGPYLDWIHPYEGDKVWDYTQAFGASLKAYELLGKEFGYSLIGCDLIGINAFFVRDDLVGNHFCSPFTSENHYEPARYDLVYRWAHPSALFGESHGCI